MIKAHVVDIRSMQEKQQELCFCTRLTRPCSKHLLELSMRADSGQGLLDGCAKVHRPVVSPISTREVTYFITGIEGEICKDETRRLQCLARCYLMPQLRTYCTAFTVWCDYNRCSYLAFDLQLRYGHHVCKQLAIAYVVPRKKCLI